MTIDAVIQRSQMFDDRRQLLPIFDKCRKLTCIIMHKHWEMYVKWNNIPHYTHTEINGRGPCEPSRAPPQVFHKKKKYESRTTPSFPLKNINHQHEMGLSRIALKR